MVLTVDVLDEEVVGREGVGATWDDELGDELIAGIVAERVGAVDERRLDADLEGPNSAATCAERETNFLYSYLSTRALECDDTQDAVRLTSNVLFQFAVSF